MATGNWLEQLLSNTNAATAALLRAAAANSGGVQAPDDAAPTASAAPVEAAPAVPANPLLAMLQGAQNWQRKAKHARLGPSKDPNVKLLTNPGRQGLEAVASVTTHGPRAGLAKQSFDLGDGRRANVYFDENGRRRVFVFRP